MILASQSPRRHNIMKIAGYEFRIVKPDIDESIDASLSINEFPVELAYQKARQIADQFPGELVIGADTIVVLNNEIIGKPVDRDDAIAMLSRLSGNMHIVITGVCVIKDHKVKKFSDTSKVHFEKLTLEEITYYVDNYKPYDKAGAYGVQDWIGMAAIKRIDGSFYNVMGLPIHKLYRVLKKI
jgi:septum formation protein